jgi:hypothetical protein
MTTTQNEFANELAVIMGNKKIKDKAFIDKYFPIIKQGLLDAAEKGDNYYSFKIHEHEPNPKYFRQYKDYKKHYNPTQYHDNLIIIASMLGVALPKVDRDTEVVFDCPEDVSEDDNFEYDSECDDIPDKYFKRTLSFVFEYPKYDASVIDDKCAVCLEEFTCGQTVRQCKGCKDCVHYGCSLDKDKTNLRCVYCPKSSNNNYYNVNGKELIPRTKKD